MSLTVLGNKVDGFLTKDQLESFPNPSFGILREITFETHEFCSLCPVTNQPDLYTLKITYVPEQKCVESKSLKLYLTQWRNQGIFGEAVATTICNELYEALEPLKVEVVATQQVRGGLQMTTTAVRYQ
jgi:7-cyano-7-deazaguanine reductase